MIWQNNHTFFLKILSIEKKLSIDIVSIKKDGNYTRTFIFESMFVNRTFYLLFAI